MYKLAPLNPLTGLQDFVVLDNKFWVSINEENPDYQAYLKWLAEGNQPLPAENA